MPRTLDHLVLCVADLERARTAYAALGFTLTPAATHPFGTNNSLVQFAGRNFLELLALRDVAAIPPFASGCFSFAAFNAAFLDRQGEGASMLVFASDNARADVAAFRAAGLTTYEPFDFGRDAIQPDGSAARVGFSLAFVTHPAMPDTAFFTCQQRHPPKLFWKPEYQRHANGAERLVEIVMSAPDPLLLRDFMQKLTAAESVDGYDALHVGAGLDQITILRPDAIARRYPELADLDPAEPPRLRAYRVVVSDLDLARRCLDRHAIPYRPGPGAVVVPPAHAHGVIVELSTD